MNPVVIVGSGGHARVLLDVLLLSGRAVRGMTDIDPAKLGRDVMGVPILGSDDALDDHDPATVSLVNGIGSISATALRRQVYARFVERGFHFATVAHPGAMISRHSEIGSGAQILAGAVIQVGARIGDNTIVNSGAIVEHDSVIGAHCHIAPGAVLSGDVHVGDGAHVGTGASVRQGCRIGENAVVGAGAAVVCDVASGAMVKGVPAR